MKAFPVLIAVVSLGTLLTFSGCGGKGGSAETTQDKQFGTLSTKPWNISSVTLGGVDQTSKWTGFQLTISGTKGSTTFNYSCASRPALSPWKASGSWAFGTDPVTQIIRDKGTADELNLTYTVTATTLRVSFTFTGSGYTRVNNVTGDWVFTFTN